MTTNEKMRKWISILLCLCMLVQNAPVFAFAAETDNLCDHHTQHSADVCGYVAAVAGADCTHEHSEDCYAIVSCVHICGDECGQDCAHECTVESGCITMERDCHHTHGDCGFSEGTAEVPCGHVHDEACGYVAASQGTACGHSCADHGCTLNEDGQSYTCLHAEHDDTCGYAAPVEGVACGHVEHLDCGYAPATEGTPCTHVCEVKVNSADSCYKLLCSHKNGGHDDACGYVEAVEGSECTFGCEECKAEEVHTHVYDGEAQYAQKDDFVHTVTRACTTCEEQPTETVDEGHTYIEGVCVCGKTEPQPEPQVLTVTAWSWVDDYEIIDPDYMDAVIPGVGAENPIDWETLVEFLPAYITAQVNGEEVELPVTWECDTFPEAATGGKYTVKAILPVGYVLGEGVTALEVDVDLGTVEQYAITPSQPANGDGTESNPYQITTADELYWFAAYVNNGNASACAKLMNDITVNENVLVNGALNSDTSGLVAWTPIGVRIGSSTKAFSGTFDGGNHTISGLYVSAASGYQGLIGFMESATVKNVTVANSYFSGTTNIGAVVGCYGTEGVSTVTNCHNVGSVVIGSNYYVGGVVGGQYAPATYHAQIVLSNCSNSGSVTGAQHYVGGIIGYAEYFSEGAAISNCTNTGTVTNTSTSRAQGTGGIAGYFGGSSVAKVEIVGCTNSGTIQIAEGGKQDYMGGIIGQNSNGHISDCNNSGTISGYQYVGGIVGSGGTVSKCSNTGSVSGTEAGIGGIAGRNSGTVTTCTNNGPVQGGRHIGGIVGSGAGVSGCTNTGNITSNSYGVGGVIGYIGEAGTVTGCHNEGTVKGTYYIGGVVGYHYTGAVTYTKCSNKGNVEGSAQNVGGLFGRISSGSTVSECYNEGAVTCTGTYNKTDNYGVGGLAGTTYSAVTFEDCYNTGSVDGGTNTYIGGLVGFFHYGSGITENYIKRSHNTGSVTGGSYTGGLFGTYESNGVSEECYNTGSVNGNNYVGGLVGYRDYTGSSDKIIKNCYNTGSIMGSMYVGGLFGNTFYENCIETSYNIGTVSGSSYLGGVIGYNKTVTNCYYLDTCVTKGNTVTGATALTVEQMTDDANWQTNFAGFDATNVWSKDTNAANTVYFPKLDSYSPALHVHSWTYTASDTNGDGVNDTITAGCNAAGCTESNGGSVTIAAPDELVYSGSSMDAVCTYTDWLPDKTEVVYNGIDRVNVTGQDIKASLTYGDVTVSVSYQIAPRVLTDSMVTISNVTYNGTEKTATVTVRYNSATTLKKGTDYEVTGTTAATEIGTYTVIVTGKGNYTGTVEKTWKINKGKLSAQITIESWTYLDTPKVPSVSNNPENAEVTYTYYISTGKNATMTGTANGAETEGGVPTYAGKYYVGAVIAETQHYIETTISPARYSFTISPKEVTDPEFDGLKATYVYDNGNEIKPTFTLKDDLGNVIHESEYTVAYSDNTDIGPATITITDNENGNYTVSGTATFAIAAHAHNWTYTAEGGTITAICTADGCTNTNGGTVTIAAPASLTYTGNAIEAVVTNELVDKTVEVTVVYTPAENLTEGKPVNSGTYTASITLGEASVSVSYTIAKAAPQVEAPTGLTAVYGQTLADVTLPDGWEWVDSTLSVGNVGSQEFNAVYPESQNYNAKEAALTVTVVCDHSLNSNTTSTCKGILCENCGTWYGAGNGDNHLKIGPCDCGLTAYPIWVSGIQVTSDNKDNVIPFISGGAGMPGIRYVPDTNVLYLAGKFGDPDADNIAVKAIGDLTVEVTNTCAVYGNVDVTGKLNIIGEKTMTVYGYSYGIQAASVAFGNDVHVIIKGAQAVKANDVTGSGYCRITADEGFIPFVAPGGESYYEVAGKKMLVAMVTVGESTTYFHTLDDAVTAAEKGTETAPATVTLLCDVDLGDSCQEITSGVFTLDLNGFELASTNSSAGVLYLQGGNITITDGSAEQDGTILAAGSYGTGVYASGGTLTITGGKITGTGTGTDGWGVAIRYGSLTITGGEISGTEHGVDVDRSTVTITGGEISGTENGVFAAYSSEVTIAGGTISGKDIGVYVYSDSTVTFAGGTISSDMYGVLAFLDGTVKITGGEISVDGESSYGVYANESTVSITGGTISGAVNDLCTIENSSITLGLGEDGVGATFPGGITVEDATLNGILAEGAAYWQGDKMLTDIADDATEITDGDVTVKAACKHENATYPEITDTQHKLVCSCGFEETKDHRFAPDTHECICRIIETFAVTVENEGGTADKVTLSNTTAVYGQDYVTHISASVGSDVEVWGIKYSGEDGWIGNGWFTYDENTETLTVYGQYVTGDLVINAVPIIYITTDLAGGTLTEKWQYTYEVLDGRISEYREYSEEAVALYGEYVYDEETGEMSFIPDPNKVFRKDGYRVAGYEDAAGNLYSADHAFPLTGDLSVTLVWECIHQDEVKFRDNGTGSHDGYCINCGEPLGHYAQRPHDFHNDAHQCVCGLVETFKIHTNIDGDAAFEWTTAMDFGSSIKNQLDDGLVAYPDMTPTRSGYTFTGEWIFWLDEACSKKYDGTTVPAQDIWVQPVFVPILYRITWDMGTCDYKLISPDVLPEKLEYCADAQTPFHTISFEYIKAPAGYEFMGFVDGEGNQLQLISSDLHKLHLTVSGDMTVKAVVEPKSYAATWESGDGDSYEKEFKYGETITIPDGEAFADTFRKAGYTHTGWEGYAEGMTMPIGGVTFTAKWQINEAVLPVTSGKYTGKAHTPAVIVNGLTEERDFTVTYPADMTNVGEKIITVTGKLGGTTTVTYTIEKADAPVITFPQVRNHIIYGQLLQDAKLEFYRNDEGTFDWAAPDGKPESSGDYALDFYPADLDNYDWQACTWQSHGAVWVEARNALCAMGAVIVDPAVGTGTVSIEGWTYGDAANAPVPVSQTNGTDAVTYRYKATGADDSTYSEQVPVNAGSYTVQATFAATVHYTEAAATAVFTISKTPLTVTAKDSTITYGDAPENAGVTYTGFVNGETESVLSGSLAYSYNYEQFGDVGSYTITPSGLTSGNYEITFTPGTLTVEPKYIEVVAEEVEKTYGDPDPEFLYWVDGLEDGDTLSGALSREQGEDAGSYAITQGTLDGGKNYRISRFYDANLTIRPKRISAGDFTVTPSSMPYTGQPQTVKITVPAGAEYDVLEGSLTATDVGMYEFTIQFKGNYSGIFTQGFEILCVAPEFTAPVANELTYSGGDQALVTAGNTADGKLVYSLAENGEYTETIPTGKNAGNYTVWYYVQGDENHTDSAKASVTVNIGKAKLTVAAKDNTITYGDAPENAGVTYTGFVNGETESVLTGELTYSYNYEQFGDVGTYTITLAGLTSGNYEITFTPGTLRVEKKTITVKADAASKIYGEADLELTYQVEGLVNGDELTGELMRAAGENVGVYAITQGTLTAGDNYSITFTGADFAITKAQQTIKLDATAAELACTKTLERTAQAIGTVSYTSSDASVATVDASGKVTALKPGTVTITVNAAETGNYFPAQAAYTVTVRHNYSAVATKPTCEDKGFTTYTCACGDYYVADEVTELGHTPKAAEEENRVEATCTDAGSYELAVYCAVCGEELERTGYTIPAQGHSLGTWQVTKPAGCTTKGVERRECSDCDHYETRTIPFTGHGYDNEWDTSCSNCGQRRKIATVSMFRMYNPYSGEHFYTGSEVERDNLVAVGWNYEGVAFNAPVYVGKPVYRYYHPGIGDHHYTMSSEEGAALVAAGWNYEGVAWNSASEGHVPYYRLLNPYATVGAHHFTSSVEERDYLISVGWIAEGIGWYVMRY